MLRHNRTEPTRKNERTPRAGPARQANSRRRNQNAKRRTDRRFVPNPDAESITVEGVLELHPEHYGFLRRLEENYLPSANDVFVPANLIAKYALREGVHVRGLAQQLRPGEGPRLHEVLDVDGRPADDYRNVKEFDSLTAISPESQLKLETASDELSGRVIDLLAPLGRGQRALIVAPPRSGKTVLLQKMSQAVAQNYPEVKQLMLLVDERPEEATDMQRNARGEVVASTLDRDVQDHVRLSQLVVERAKRLAEEGQDVVLYVDSLTRIARAFNKWVGNTGRTMTGGIDIRALDTPKKLFATARAFDEGGSLTIIATALVDTGSRMDQVIFEELKGTGNMELVLSRKLADRRVWPAIDISMTGTRREERLLDPSTLNAVTALRRTLSSVEEADAMEQITKHLSKFPTNSQFIEFLNSAWTR